MATYSGHVNVRTGPWTNARGFSGLIRHVFYALANVLQGKLESCIHVDITWICTTYLKNYFMAMVFLDGSGTLQQLFRNSLRIMTEFKLLTLPSHFPDLNVTEYLWDVLDQQIWSKEAHHATCKTWRICNLCLGARYSRTDSEVFLRYVCSTRGAYMILASWFYCCGCSLYILNTVYGICKHSLFGYIHFYIYKNRLP